MPCLGNNSEFSSSRIHTRQAEFEQAFDFEPAVQLQPEKSKHPEIRMFAEFRYSLALVADMTSQPPAIEQRLPKTCPYKRPAPQNQCADERFHKQQPDERNDR